MKLFRKKKKTLQQEPQTKAFPGLLTFNGLGQIDVSYWQLMDKHVNYKLLIQKLNELAELYIPVQYWAKQSEKVKYKIYRKDSGKEVELKQQNQLSKLLEKPNQFQGWNEFYRDIVAYKKAFGNSYINAFAPERVSGRTPQRLFNMPPQHAVLYVNNIDDKGRNNATQILNGDFRFIRPAYYEFQHEGTNIRPSAEDVLHLKEYNHNFDNGQFIYGFSPIAPLARNITNIENAYDAKNKQYKSPLGMFYNAAKDAQMAGYINNPNEQDAAQERIEKFGMTKGQHPFMYAGGVSLGFTQIESQVQNLAIPENIASDFDKICMALNIPTILLTSSDAIQSTYTNKAEARQAFFEGAFKAEHNAIFNDLNAFLQQYPAFENYIIYPDFSAIPELQSDVSKTQERELVNVQAGLITRNQYLDAIDRPTVDKPEFDEYYYYTDKDGWQPVSQNAQGQKSQKAESYNDYPKAAQENARRALRIRDENEKVKDCGTRVGWIRANQLAKGENLTRNTIARIAAFERHRANSDGDPKKNCGALMWLAWGGDEGIEWAQRKLDEIDNNE